MINRRQFVRFCGAAACSLTCGKALAAPAQKKSPNFIFILVDDLGWTDLGCFGSKFYETLEYWPEHQGFDINMGGWKTGLPTSPGRYFSPYGNPRLKDGPKGEHLPERLGRETANFIKANKDKPFLAYLSFYSVHTPLMARDELTAKYRQKKKMMEIKAKWGRQGKSKVRIVQGHAVYAAMIEAMDSAVGTVLDSLEDAAVADNTIVFFMSDNGGLSTAGGHPTSNLPLHAGKGWLYEGGIREPMIVKWPGVTKPASQYNEPVTSTDFYPTMLEMAGLPPKPKRRPTCPANITCIID